MFLAILIFAILFPALSIFFLLLGLKHKSYSIIGLFFLFLCIPLYLFCWQVILWQFDLIRGWELRQSISTPSYKITFVHKPDIDFYDTSLYIKRADGKSVRILLDGDDHKWWSLDIIQKDNKIYFTPFFKSIDHSTTYFNTSANTVYSGTYSEYHHLSEMEFK